MFFSFTKRFWPNFFARKYKVSWNPWASFAWRRGCGWRIFVGLQPFIWEMVGQPYNPVYAQLSLLFSGWLWYFLCFSLWALNHAMFFGGLQVFLTQCPDFLWEPAVLLSKAWLPPLIKSVSKRCCLSIKSRCFCSVSGYAVLLSGDSRRWIFSVSSTILSNPMLISALEGTDIEPM